MAREHEDPLTQEASPEPASVGFTKALRASGELADLAAQLLGVLYPDKRLTVEQEGGWFSFSARPALSTGESRRLLNHLHDLVDRPEWRRRHAVAREVTDVTGRRVEVVVPLAPGAYQGGEAIVGPFASQDAAKEWYASVRLPGLAADTLQVADAWLCDLFMLGELLDD